MKNQLSLNMGNLMLTLSYALDAASTELNYHQIRVAYIACELAKAAKLKKDRCEKIFIAALLHDIGAIDADSKVALLKNEVFYTESHCIRGQKLFENIAWLKPASKLIRYHHTKWSTWDKPISNHIIFDSQIIHLADIIERYGKRDVYVLHQDEEIKKMLKEISGDEIHPDVIDLFLQVSDKESFWLDVTSPRIYSILLHNCPISNSTIHFDEFLELSSVFGHIIDFKSRFTSSHSAGVAHTATYLAKIIGMTDEEIELMELAGQLHDIGKIAVPNELIDKTGKLTLREFAILKQHPYYTFSILKSINPLSRVAKWAGFHHERLDGSGYPFRKEGSALCIGSRLLSVADIFTALVEKRPYRTGLELKEIKKILSDQANKNYIDKDVVKIVLENGSKLFDQIKSEEIKASAHYDTVFSV